MTAKLLLLILSLGLSSVAATAQDNYRPGKKDLSWGAEAGGLRLAVWTAPAGDKVFAAVRNSSTRKICYCGTQEIGMISHSVSARKNAAEPWRALAIKPPAGEYIFLPICHTKFLKPGEEMPPFPLPTGPQKKDHSFNVNLSGYAFPPDWSGTVGVKIVLSVYYCNRSDNKTGEVESRPFEIKLPPTETTAETKNPKTGNLAANGL